jgi:hypothetical protein
VDLVDAIWRIPDLLSTYSDFLHAAASRRRASPKLIKSRVLYLLYLAVKRAQAKKSDYQAYKSLAALVTPLWPEREDVDYRTVANRVARFRTVHPDEVKVARTLVAASRANGILMLMLLVETPQGFCSTRRSRYASASF